MKIDELQQLLGNKLSALQAELAHNKNIGNIVRVLEIEAEIQETESTLEKITQ